jgi:hypothetical protein
MVESASNVRIDEMSLRPCCLQFVALHWSPAALLLLSATAPKTLPATIAALPPAMRP